MATDKMAATGLTIPLPEISGAEPVGTVSHEIPKREEVRYIP
jgi:hypothetical protein